MIRLLALSLLLASCSYAPAASQGVAIVDRPERHVVVVGQPVQPEPTGVTESGIEGGVASFVGPRFGPRYLALPEGPGHRVTICGDAACVTRTSTDAGPDLAMQRAGRVADLSFQDFATVCGCDPWTVGLTHVSVQYLGAAPTPPQTDSEGTR